MTQVSAQGTQTEITPDVAAEVSRLSTNLDVFVEGAENIIDLVLKSTRQHLVRLVKNEHLDIACT